MRKQNRQTSTFCYALHVNEINLCVLVKFQITESSLFEILASVHFHQLVQFFQKLSRDVVKGGVK